jgi:hypothetical protein
MAETNPSDGRRARRDGGAARILVVGPDDFARTIEAVRLAKQRGEAAASAAGSR